MGGDFVTVKKLFDMYEYITCTSPEEESTLYRDAYSEGLQVSSDIDPDFVEDMLSYNPETFKRDDLDYPVNYMYHGEDEFTTTSRGVDVSHSYFAIKEQSESTTVMLVEVSDLL